MYNVIHFAESSFTFNIDYFSLAHSMHKLTRLPCPNEIGSVLFFLRFANFHIYYSALSYIWGIENLRQITIHTNQLLNTQKALDQFPNGDTACD